MIAVNGLFIELFDRMQYIGGLPSRAQALQMRA